MRILLASNASHAPPRGGATRSNLLWLDRLARSGHECRIVCGPPGEGAELWPHESIRILAVEDPARRVQLLGRQIGEFQPHWVLVSSEDLGHALLRQAHRAAPGRVVYLAHTPQLFPFGPASWNSDPHAAELVADAAGIVAIGRHMAGYVRRELGREVVVIHPPIYGDGPFANLANFEHGLITMINPCAVKGISIFLEVAARLPEREFGVVPGWGTTREDRGALERLPNVRFLPNARNIDDVLGRTGVLLAPSLWHEGFGLIVVESMLRGVPVVSSDSGGLCDARCGVGRAIPVRPIESYQAAFDEHGLPRPVVPPNDAGEWVEALGKLLGERGAYERESAASREAALGFVTGLDAGRMEAYLQALAPNAGARRGEAGMESLSPEKRALLLQRLRRRAAP